MVEVGRKIELGVVVDIPTIGNSAQMVLIGSSIADQRCIVVPGCNTDLEGWRLFDLHP